MSPLTALAVERQPRSRSPNGDPTQSVAGKILAGAISHARSRRPARRRATPTRSQTLHAHQRDPGRRSARSTTRSTSTSCCTTTTAQRSASRCSRSSPTSGTRQMVVRLLGNQSIKDEGNAADFVAAAPRAQLHFANADDHDDRRARAAQEHQRLPHRRHGDARADRDRRSWR